jgi:hypothetical protein
LTGNTFSGNVGDAIGPIVATSGDDAIVVTATSITLGGNTINFDASIGPLTIDGGDGDDTLTIDLSSGPIPVPITLGVGCNRHGQEHDDHRVYCWWC